MKINELNGKNVCILGFGREGQSVLHALSEYAPDADVTVSDVNCIPNAEYQLPEDRLQCGPEYLQNLDSFDVIIKSPGIPPLPEIQRADEKVTNGTQIFLDTVQAEGSLVIGVTGSKGKSTTATLISEILQELKNDVYLVGNIGYPALDELKNARKNTIFVHEMSSFQLMNLESSPDIAIITSFFHEHLDYHGSVESYMEAKGNITRFQKTSNFAFYAADSEEAQQIAEQGMGILIPVFATDALVELKETKLLGSHNLNNIACACKVAQHLGVPDKSIIKAVQSFEGLPHRLQSLGEHNDIKWINDSIATNPVAAMAAIEALGEDLKTMILGGYDRGSNFVEFGKAVTESAIEHVILLPDNGARIRDAINAQKNDIVFHDAENLEEAVAIAKDYTPKGSICALSPASPSYNMFANFEERGETFMKLVRRAE